MKAFVLLLVVVVIIGGSVGGAFIGGVAVGKGQNDGPMVADIPVPGGSARKTWPSYGSSLVEARPEQAPEARAVGSARV